MCGILEDRGSIVSDQSTLQETRPLDRLRSRPFEPFSEADLHGTVGARLSKMIGRHGSRRALFHGDEAVTYADLGTRACDLAWQIARCESEADRQTPVALLTDDPVLRIIGMVAAQKLGRPFLPLDPSAPAGRLQLMLRDSGSSALITNVGERFTAIVAEFDGTTVSESRQTPSELFTDRSVSPESASHVFYTSGSTGQPKSIAQTHAMVMHKMTEYASSLRINPDDRLSLVASPGFAESWNAVFMALLNGASLTIREAKHHGIEGLADWMAASGLTIFHCVPTLLRAVVAGLPEGVHVPSLRILNMGGETVSRADLQACWNRLNSDCVIVNSFGTTETKLISHYFVDRETDLIAETIPVGRPIPDTEVRIVDQEGNPVADGEPGEIEVHSQFIARQYQSAAAADQHRFASSDVDDRLTRYRTGDLGRFNSEGCLEHLGRIDGIVKLRGYRVELAEVESTLQTHPAVLQATVVVYSPSPQTRQLIATYIAEGAVAAEELQHHLSEALPDYMVPSRFIPVTDYPVNINGKVDRTAVLEQVQQQLASPSAAATESPVPAMPSCPVRDQVVRLVQEALEIDHVDPNDGFVELGGDSLSATELLISLEKTFGSSVNRDELFDARSLVELAERIESSNCSENATVADGE
jgi:amino acid adenylation domain-containing protein